MSSKFILFDFDGVIVDTFSIAFEVYNMICPNMKEDDLRKCFEGNINNWLESLKHDNCCRHDIDFVKEYVPKSKKANIFPGMNEVIESLSKSYKLAIISSSLTAPILEILSKLGIKQFFADVLGNDVHKDKVEKINLIFDKYNVSPSNCIFVTDTLGDLIEANKAGIQSIAVSWGFNKRETLMKGNPWKIIDVPNEMIGIVDKYFNMKQ